LRVLTPFTKGLLHNGDEGLLGARTGLQEAREVAAAAQPRDRQLEVADARLPETFAVAVAAREALRALLVQGGARLTGDLALHELAYEPGETLAQNVGMLVGKEFAQELFRAQTRLGHRGAPLVDLCNGSDDCAAHGGHSLPVRAA
jgi:hypothetical protein